MTKEQCQKRQSMWLMVWHRLPWVSRNRLWMDQGSEMQGVLVQEFGIKAVCLECMSLMAEVEIVCPYCGCGRVDALGAREEQEVQHDVE